MVSVFFLILATEFRVYLDKNYKFVLDYFYKVGDTLNAEATARMREFDKVIVGQRDDIERRRLEIYNKTKSITSENSKSNE